MEADIDIAEALRLCLVETTNIDKAYSVISCAFSNDHIYFRLPATRLLSFALDIGMFEAAMVLGAHPFNEDPFLSVDEVGLYVRMLMTRHPKWKHDYKNKTRPDEEDGFPYDINWRAVENRYSDT